MWLRMSHSSAAQKEGQMILERRIQKLMKGVKLEQYTEWEKKFDKLEKGLGGCPPKKHLWLMYGGDEFGTIIWEREWDSLAVMEAFYDKFPMDEVTKILEHDIVSSERVEIYGVAAYKDIYGE
jgi:hypothetical protein